MTVDDTGTYVRLRLQRAGCEREVFAEEALAALHEAAGSSLHELDRMATAALREAAPQEEARRTRRHDARGRRAPSQRRLARSHVSGAPGPITPPAPAAPRAMAILPPKAPRMPAMAITCRARYRSRSMAINQLARKPISQLELQQTPEASAWSRQELRQENVRSACARQGAAAEIHSAKEAPHGNHVPCGALLEADSLLISAITKPPAPLMRA
jgi:hypothetical protein